jgi:hypothetical protein
MYEEKQREKEKEIEENIEKLISICKTDIVSEYKCLV